MTHQKLCFLLTNLTMPIVFISTGGGRQNYQPPVSAATASWEAEATGGGLQIILPSNYLLTAVTSCFRLSICGGGPQNVLPPKKILF